jgi:endonuclease-8
VPEGDTIFRAARTLHRVLAGQQVTRFESAFPALTRVHDDAPITGREIVSVTARGKHLLIAFSGSLVLHTHLRMNGSWHIYRPGEPWRRPPRDMRVLVGTATAVAVGFNVPVAELLRPGELDRHPQMRHLGPDLLADLFEPAAVVERARRHPHDAVGDVLLNQRVVAGIGNVLKSETLFVSRVNPFARIADLADAVLLRIVGEARRLIAASVVEPGRMLTPAGGRRTTGSMNPSVRLWVYGRGGKPCRVCGTAVRSRKTGLDARLTYWCPTCQP